MKEDGRRDNRYNKSEDFIVGITNVYVNVRGDCMWPSARMGYVDSWYGQVVVVRSWTFDEGSWHRSSRGDTARYLMLVCWDWSGRWMQLDGHCGQLRSVESLNAAGWLLRAAEVGRVVVVASRYSGSSSWVVAMLGQSVTASRFVDWKLYSWGVMVGRSISRFWQYVGLTRGCVDLFASP